MRHSDPIGMFDSGVGGLTVMHEFMRKLPNESITYFGDTARVPYGGKSKETIIRYSVENASFLLEKNIKLLVVACNTASAAAIERLRQVINIPIIGVIEPGAQKAVSVTRNQRIAVLGTKATIESGAYQKEIKKHLPQASIFPIACPLFVPIVEEHFFEHPIAQMAVKEYLRPLKNVLIDTILLGCTHYPFLINLIQKEVGAEVQIVDSASTCVEKAAEILSQQGSHSFSNAMPYYEYFVSDDPNKFKLLAENLFGRDIPEVHLAGHLVN